jgi:hypothetical protein
MDLRHGAVDHPDSILILSARLQARTIFATTDAMSACPAGQSSGHLSYEVVSWSVRSYVRVSR